MFKNDKRRPKRNQIVESNTETSQSTVIEDGNNVTLGE